MAKWGPRAKAPKGNTEEYIRWLGEDIALFQRERPHLPHGRPTKKVITAWDKARQAAELEDARKESPEWQATGRRFHRTRTISFGPTKKRARKSESR